MLIDLLKSIFGDLIWFVIGIVAVSLYRWLSNTKPIRKLWRINNAKELHIITATSGKTDTGEYLRPTTGIGQLRALGLIVESLSKAYNIEIQNIYLSVTPIEKAIEKDIILLGGPKNNELTREFLDKISNLKIFNQDGSTVIWYANGEKETFKGESRNNTIIKDYGVAIRMDNPFDTYQKSCLCLFSGAHTYGTIAATRYFVNHYSKFIKRHKNNGNIAVLVECGVYKDNPNSIKEVYRYEF